MHKVLLTILTLVICTYGIAQQTGVQKKQFDALEERSKVKFRVIPMPSYDPSTKWGISLIAMANYYANKKDTISPPSMTGVTGFATTNGSWGTGVMQNYNFNEDKWRMNARIFYANINQELGLGQLGIADATRKMTIANASARRRVVSDLFLGLGYNFRSIKYVGRDSLSQGKLDTAGYNQRAENHGLKYFLTFDNRDNIFYPYRGWYLEYTLGQNFDNGQTPGNDQFIEHLVDLRYFTSLNKNSDHVLAAHMYGRFLSGNATNENYSFYGRSAIQIQRGYEVGNFIDKNMFNTEVEYRRETPWLKHRLGFIGFVSAGKVFGDYNSFSNAEWLPAIGAGVRYRFLEYERMNFKTDVAYGKEGWTVYFGIREAF